MRIGRLDAPYFLQLSDPGSVVVSGVRVQRLGDLCSFVGYGMVDKSLNLSEDVPAWEFSPHPDLSQSKADSAGVYPVKLAPDDILVFPLIKKVSFISEEAQSSPVSCFVFRLVPGNSHQYFKHFFSTPFFQQQLSEVMQYNVVIDLLKRFKAIRCCVPSLESQKGLAAVIVQAEVEAELLRVRSEALLKQAKNSFETLVMRTQLSLEG
ncbi:MAG: hypothetical protein WCP97_02125 [bacterium]